MAVVHFTMLRAVPNNLKVSLRRLLNMLEKQILTSVIEIQKRIGPNHAFIKDNLSRIFVYSFTLQRYVWRSFPN